MHSNNEFELNLYGSDTYVGVMEAIDSQMALLQLLLFAHMMPVVYTWYA